MKPNIKLVLEHTKSLRVLYVEDDKDLLESTAELLENYFLSVDRASDGEEGLKKYKNYAQENQQPYDLVITDINMPKMDGIEMSEQIREITPREAIVLTTAHNEAEYLLKAIEVNVDGFIIKPLDHKQLLKVLYKVSQAIVEYKFFLKYADKLER